MIFDYNPITGLNYYSNENEFLLLELPEVDITEEVLEEWRKALKETGLAMVDSTVPDIEVFSPIISNVPYEIFGERLEQT